MDNEAVDILVAQVELDRQQIALLRQSITIMGDTLEREIAERDAIIDEQDEQIASLVDEVIALDAELRELRLAAHDVPFMYGGTD